MKKIPVEVRCSECGAIKVVKPSRARYFKTCSKSCWKRMMLGHAPSNYKGGRMVHKGYILVLEKGHPQADRDGYVPEHRLVMEKHLGRFLRGEEVVHHKNADRGDNRIENLQLAESQSEHMRIHHPKGSMIGSYHAWKGRRHSEESKAKMRAAHAARKHISQTLHGRASTLPSVQ